MDFTFPRKSVEFNYLQKREFDSPHSRWITRLGVKVFIEHFHDELRGKPYSRRCKLYNESDVDNWLKGKDIETNYNQHDTL